MVTVLPILPMCGQTPSFAFGTSIHPSLQTVASSIVSAVALIFFIISVHEVTPACKSIQEDFSFPSRVGHDSIRVGPLSQLILKQMVSANSSLAEPELATQLG